MDIQEVPTGHICIINGEKGRPLEFLSIGDYGKEQNVKADFLGLTKDIAEVPHGKMLPLEEKWVITISSQYGCSMNCKFCDVPKVGPGYNATLKDLIDQVLKAINLHPEVKHAERINLHYARMGEPTWNIDVILSAYYLSRFFKKKNWGFNPVVSTMMPENNPDLFNFLNNWLVFKDLNDAGLQVSINTTDHKRRAEMMPNAMSLPAISRMFYDLLSTREIPKGRKIALNFALTDDDEVDAELLRELFTPRYFICKLTPIHKTEACKENKYKYDFPYKKVEQELKDVGFDVIVFTPSKEEDESRVTCGNAILSDNL